MDELHSQLSLAFPVVMISVFLALFVAERHRPLRRSKRRLLQRLKANAALTVLTLAVAALVVRPVVVSLAVRAGEVRTGVLGVAGIPRWMQFGAGFLLMDFTFYLWHRANHEIGLLWRLHNVHHFDPDLDVTTSFRFHAGEILLSVGFRTVQVWLLGITIPILIAYEGVFLAATMFHHSNIRLPLGFERMLNRVFVTPRMHGIHHSVVKSETNSNYGSVFRWWDIAARTLVLDVPQQDIRIGVPGYMFPEQNRLAEALKAPFTRQKDYWAWPNGKRPERPREKGAPPARMLRE